MASEDVFEESARKAMDDFGEPPRIILTGRTGAGKSSIVNALLGRHAQTVDVIPCTEIESQLDFTAGDTDIKLVDVPGFAEAGKHEAREAFILSKLPDVHVALLVVGAPDRAFELERAFLRRIKDTDPAFPVLTVANKIDLLPPASDRSIRTLNLERPQRPKEHAIVRWCDGIISSCEIEKDRCAVVAAGESFDQVEQQYGILQLKEKIVSLLPEAAKNYAARVWQIEELRHGRAQGIIWAASVGAAGAALQPFPIADAFLITPIQVGMIVSVAMVYGAELNYRTGLGLLKPALLFLLGPLAAKELAKFLPGFGSAIGAAIAGATTLAVGNVFEYFFMRGNFRPSKEELVSRIRAEYAKASQQKDKIAEEARNKK